MWTLSRQSITSTLSPTSISRKTFPMGKNKLSANVVASNNTLQFGCRVECFDELALLSQFKAGLVT